MGEVDKKNLKNARGAKSWRPLRKRDLVGSWQIEIYLSSIREASLVNVYLEVFLVERAKTYSKYTL